MESYEHFRKYISKVIRENINYKFPVSNEKLDFHVTNELKKFNQVVKNETRNNNYPFIRYYLRKAIEEMNDSIKTGKIHADGIDEINWAS